MAMQQLRQVVQAEFRRQQLTLDKEALALIVDYVAQNSSGLEPIYTLIDKLDTGDARTSSLAAATSKEQAPFNLDLDHSSVSPAAIRMQTIILV
jgi:hypothetical protein